MRELAENEVISLTGLLKMEKDNLALAKATQTLISDQELKKQAESGIMAAQGRIKGIQQFINENQIADVKGDV
ncbi:MAG: hypothetical protein ACOCZ5_03335 [bacterium]